jgi:hypothetical protein
VQNMERMHGNLERFEVFGKSILTKISQSSNGSSSQPQASSNPPSFAQHPSQTQASSQLNNQYGEGLNAAQPTTNAPQPSYVPPLSQTDPYTDPNYIDYTVFNEFLASDG